MSVPLALGMSGCSSENGAEQDDTADRASQCDRRAVDDRDGGTNIVE
ncbi:hypothetical protein [Haloarcula sp. Atlit-7R]|nr:hypothetical protein [Haloarcula sp. Atlit-7R]